MRNPGSLKRQGLILLAGVLVFLLLAPRTYAYTNKALGLTVYSDGYVHVTQALVVDSRTASIQVTLLSPAVSNLIAADQNGSPLSYGFASGGANITIYTLGSTLVTLRYDTNALTAKNGTVWTLEFTSSYNSTVVLPQLSTLTSVSGTPYSINETGNSPQVSLSPGTWKVSYGVPLGITTITTSTSTTSPGGSLGGGGFGSLELEEVAALVAVVVAGGISFWWWRGRSIGPISDDLRPDDVLVLNFIQEKGGKVLEPEIRTKFALPKTSAWRQIKRLERLGYVKVTKIGSQNQIEILKERNQGN